MITTSPGDRAGTGTRSAQARNATPFIAPPGVIGAVIPESLNAPAKVAVFR